MIQSRMLKVLCIIFSPMLLIIMTLISLGGAVTYAGPSINYRNQSDVLIDPNSEANLLAHWSFNECGGDQVYNEVMRYGNVGLLNGEIVNTINLSFESNFQDNCYLNFADVNEFDELYGGEIDFSVANPPSNNQYDNYQKALHQSSGTFEFLIKPSQQKQHSILTLFSEFPSAIYGIRINKNYEIGPYILTDSGTILSETGLLRPDEWNHVAWTWNSSSLTSTSRLYISGTLITETTLPAPINFYRGLNLRIGNGVNAGDFRPGIENYFEGGLDEIFYYDTALDEGRIVEHATKYSEFFDPVATPTLQQEKDELMLIYSMLEGPSWKNNTGWGTENNICDWYGVICYKNEMVGLDLSNNNLTGTINNHIKNLPTLQFLNLSNNQIKGIIWNQNLFFGTNSLTALDLSGNQIKFESGASIAIFQNLDNVRFIDLSDNGLTHLDNVSFNGALQLEALSLSNNQISSLSDTDVDRFKVVSHLDLSNNLLTSVDAVDWSLTKIKVLDLENNRLASSDLIISPNFTDLDLSFNNITTIASVDFPRFTRLESLNLRNNSITSLSGTYFENNTLRYLNFQKNQIQNDPSLKIDFSVLPSLLELNLKQNNIDSLGNYNLSGLGNLEYLNVSFNDLTSLNDVNFDNLSNLKHLDLQANKIKSIQNNSISALESLFALNLVNNQISSLEGFDFGKLPNIQTLYLRNNEIDTLVGIDTLAPSTFLQSNRIQSLDGVNLDGVFILYLQDQKDKLKEIGNFTYTGTYLFLSNNGIETISANDFEQTFNLNYLYLDGNQISSIGDFTEADLPRLQLINLASNQIGSLDGIDFSRYDRLRSLNFSRNQLDSLAIFTDVQSVPEGFTGVGTVVPHSITDLFFRGNELNQLVTDLCQQTWDIAFNALAQNKVTDCIFNSKTSDTQTVPPLNIKVVSANSSSEVMLAWDLVPPILNSNGGYYQIRYTATDCEIDDCNGAALLWPQRIPLSTDSAVIDGLLPNTKYRFWISTVTEPHNENPNRLESIPSDVVSGTTSTEKYEAVSLYALSMDTNPADPCTFSGYYPKIQQVFNQATRDNPNKLVILLVDPFGDGNTHIYVSLNGAREIHEGKGLPNEDGVMSTIDEYDMTNPELIGGFIKWALNSYAEDPEIPVSFSYIGHGLPIAPDLKKIDLDFNEQSDQGQLRVLANPLPAFRISYPCFTDETLGTYGDPAIEKSLITPKALAQALRIGTQLENGSRRTLDVVDVTHCFAASYEEFFELANASEGEGKVAEIIIGSPNYAYFMPSLLTAMLSHLSKENRPIDVTSRTNLAQKLLDSYNNLLYEAEGLEPGAAPVPHPRIIVAVDPGQLLATKALFTDLAESVTLELTKSNESTSDPNPIISELQRIYSASQKYDTTYCQGDYKLEDGDGLVDMVDFVGNFADSDKYPSIQTAAKNLLPLLEKTVLYSISADGEPWFAIQTEDKAIPYWKFVDGDGVGLSLYTDFYGIRDDAGDFVSLNAMALWYGRADLLLTSNPEFMEGTTWAEVNQLFWEEAGFESDDSKLYKQFCQPALPPVIEEGELAFLNPTDPFIFPRKDTIIINTPFTPTIAISTSQSVPNNPLMQFNIYDQKGTLVYSDTISTDFFFDGQHLFEASKPFTPTRRGETYKLTAKIDADNRVEEKNEFNNVKEKTFTIASFDTRPRLAFEQLANNWVQGPNMNILVHNSSGEDVSLLEYKIHYRTHGDDPRKIVPVSVSGDQYISITNGSNFLNFPFNWNLDLEKVSDKYGVNLEPGKISIELWGVRGGTYSHEPIFLDFNYMPEKEHILAAGSTTIKEAGAEFHPLIAGECEVVSILVDRITTSDNTDFALHYWRPSDFDDAGEIIPIQKDKPIGMSIGGIDGEEGHLIAVVGAVGDRFYIDVQTDPDPVCRLRKSSPGIFIDLDLDPLSLLPKQTEVGSNILRPHFSDLVFQDPEPDSFNLLLPFIFN